MFNAKKKLTKLEKFETVNRLNRTEDQINKAPYGLPDGHYVPVNGKVPTIKDWLSNPITFEDCINLIGQGKANGIGYVLTGQDVIVIDCDGQQAIDYFENEIKNIYPASNYLGSLRVKSNTPKKDNSMSYFYRISKENMDKLNKYLSGKLIFNFGKNDQNKCTQLEIRFNKGYQVLQSIHPDTEKYYENEIIGGGPGLSYLPDVLVDKIISCYEDFTGKNNSLVINNIKSNNIKSNKEISDIIENNIAKCQENKKEYLDLVIKGVKYLTETKGISLDNGSGTYDIYVRPILGALNCLVGAQNAYEIVSNLIPNRTTSPNSIKSLTLITPYTFFDILDKNFNWKEHYNLKNLENKRLFIKNKELTSDYKFNSEGYLPSDLYSLSRDKKVTFIKSGLGTGKTFTLKNELQRLNKENNNLVTYCTSHRRSLEKQNTIFGVPARSEDISLISVNSGFSTCMDSVYSLKYLVESAIENNKYIVLVLDEVSQVIDHLIKGDTEIREHRLEVIKTFKLIWNSASKIYCADGNLCDQDIKRLALILELPENELREESFIIENTYQNLTFKAYYHQSAESLISQIKKDLSKKINNKDTRPLMVLTSGQKINTGKGTKNLGTYFKKSYSDLRLLIIDSRTSLNIESDYYKLKKAYGNDWVNHLGDYDLIICSPTIETAISFDADNKFFGVYQFNLGNQKAENMMQFMCRVRDNCDRHYFIAKPLNSNIYKDTDINLLRKKYANQLNKASKEYRKVINTINTLEGNLKDSNEITNLINSNLKLADDYIHEDAKNEAKLFNAFLETVLMDNLSYSCLQDNFEYLLTNSGCIVECFDDISDTEKQEIKLEVRENKENNIKEEIKEVIETPLISNQDYELIKEKEKRAEALSDKEINERDKYKVSLFWGSDNKDIKNNVTTDILYYFLKDKGFIKSLDNNFLCSLDKKLITQKLINNYQNITTEIDLVKKDSNFNERSIKLLKDLTDNFIGANNSLIFNKESNEIKAFIKKVSERLVEIKEELRITLPDLKDSSNYIKVVRTILNLRGYTVKRANKDNKNRLYSIERMYSDIISEEQLNNIYSWWKFKLEFKCRELLPPELFSCLDGSLSEKIEAYFSESINEIKQDVNDFNVWEKLGFMDTTKEYDLINWWEHTRQNLEEKIKKFKDFLNFDISFDNLYTHFDILKRLNFGSQDNIFDPIPF